VKSRWCFAAKRWHSPTMIDLRQSARPLASLRTTAFRDDSATADPRGRTARDQPALRLPNIERRQVRSVPTRRQIRWTPYGDPLSDGDGTLGSVHHLAPLPGHHDTDSVAADADPSGQAPAPSTCTAGSPNDATQHMAVRIASYRRRASTVIQQAERVRVARPIAYLSVLWCGYPRTHG
jgi:hypothetical protein